MSERQESRCKAPKEAAAVEQRAGDLGLKWEEGQLCGVTGRKERKPAP